MDSSLEDYLKYARLIRSGMRTALGDRLSIEDREVLRQLALRDRVEMQPISDAYSEARLRLCARRASMTPVEVAEEWSRLVLEWRAGNVARYRKGLEALSEAGRNAVEAYIATEIVPRLDVPEEGDAVQAAMDDPEGFMEQVEIECYFLENGRYPPEVEREFARVERYLEEHGEFPPEMEQEYEESRRKREEERKGRD